MGLCWHLLGFVPAPRGFSSTSSQPHFPCRAWPCLLGQQHGPLLASSPLRASTQCLACGLPPGRRGEGWAAGERERHLADSCSALKEAQVFNRVLRNPVINVTCTSLTTAFGYKGHYWNNWKNPNLDGGNTCEELTHWKRPWCWEDWGQEEKGTTEDEMAGWHHRLDGYELE